MMTDYLNKMTKMLEDQFKFDFTEKPDDIEAVNKKWEADTVFIINMMRHELDLIESRCVSKQIEHKPMIVKP
jgi:hypothetical protein